MHDWTSDIITEELIQQLQQEILVYIGVPYSSESRVIVNNRFTNVTSLAAFLMSKHINVYSPITHTHPMACNKYCALGDTYEHWRFHNEYMLSVSSAMIALLMPGWRESAGLNAEIQHMEDNKKRVWHVGPRWFLGVLRNNAIKKGMKLLSEDWI